MTGARVARVERRFRVGMNLYLWLTRLEPRHFPLLSELRKAGFDGVEIPASDYSLAEQRRIRQALDHAGLACTMATLLTREHNPIDARAGVRRAARDRLARDIEQAASLGAEALIGPMHSAHKHFTGRAPDQREFTHCVDFLQWAGDLAERSGLYLGVEPLNRFECYFLNTAEQAARLCASVDHPQVSVLYDTHHAHIEEANAFDAIVALGPRLRHFHVSESHRGTPGTGAVDWSSCFRALRTIDFSGWMVIEAFSADVPGIPDAVNIWRNCFTDEREVYLQGLELINNGWASE